MNNGSESNMKYFCFTCNQLNHTYLFNKDHSHFHEDHDYYVLQKPETSMREMADKINNFKGIYEAKIESLTVDRKIVFEKLLEEARSIKKNFEKRIKDLIHTIDNMTYNII